MVCFIAATITYVIPFGKSACGCLAVSLDQKLGFLLYLLVSFLLSFNNLVHYFLLHGPIFKNSSPIHCNPHTFLLVDLLLPDRRASLGIKYSIYAWILYVRCISTGGFCSIALQDV